jgi:hypothetical protein
MRFHRNEGRGLLVGGDFDFTEFGTDYCIDCLLLFEPGAEFSVFAH